MDWELLATLLITTVVAVGGWFIAHLLGVRQDTFNRQHEQRIKYLADSWRTIASSIYRGDEDDPREREEVRRRIENAIADIQLFGSPTQVLLAQSFAEQLQSTGSGDLQVVLLDLRDDLRTELKLEKVPRRLLHLRFDRSRSP